MFLTLCFTSNCKVISTFGYWLLGWHTLPKISERMLGCHKNSFSATAGNTADCAAHINRGCTQFRANFPTVKTKTHTTLVIFD